MIANAIAVPQMELKEGIISQNQILSYEEFKKFFDQQIQQFSTQGLLNRLTRIENFILSGQIKSAYMGWERFESEVLLNEGYGVSLLFIENINSPTGNYNFKYQSKEHKVLSNRGKLTRMGQLNEKMFQEHLEGQISEHLFEFIQDIENQIADKKTNITYKQKFYGNNPAWYGQAADAFMNHMAHFHVQVIASEVEENNKSLFAQSVFDEERDNIRRILAASTNKIAWTTGGDIVIVYKNKMFNIQLKSSMPEQEGGKPKRRIGGKLSSIELKALISQLKVDIKYNQENIALTLYNSLKTSGWVEKTTNQGSKILNQMVQEGLKLP